MNMSNTYGAFVTTSLDVKVALTTAVVPMDRETGSTAQLCTGSLKESYEVEGYIKAAVLTRLSLKGSF